MRKLAQRKCSPSKKTKNLTECATNVAIKVMKPSNVRQVEVLEVVEDTVVVDIVVEEAEGMQAEAAEVEADSMGYATIVAKPVIRRPTAGKMRLMRARDPAIGLAAKAIKVTTMNRRWQLQAQSLCA